MIYSLLSPLPIDSPHPFLPGPSPTSPHISIPHSVSKSSLPLARELLYTGYCMGTREEMQQILELMDLLEIKSQQLTMEEVEVFVTNDTLELLGENCVNIELNSPSEVEDEFEDSEQVAVQEEEDTELEQQIVPADQYEEHGQFPAFLLDKLAKINPDRRKFPSKNKTSPRMSKRRQPHTVSHSFFCQHCHMKFSKLKDKEMHALMEHSYELPFICQECGARFKLKGEIEQHMKNHGGGSFQIKCEVCDKVCKNMYQYHTHYKNHSGLKEFGCQCGKSFTTFTKLQVHELIHQPMRIPCDECGKMFRRRDHLRAHQCTGKKDQPKKLSGDVCGKVFSRKDTVRNHHKKHNRNNEEEDGNNGVLQ